MFHDLDVLVPPEAREAALQTLQRLGYDVVAFTTVIDGQKKLSDKDIPRRQEYAALKAKQNVLHPDKAKRRRGMTVLERVTLVIDDPSHVCFVFAHWHNPIVNLNAFFYPFHFVY